MFYRYKASVLIEYLSGLNSEKFEQVRRILRLKLKNEQVKTVILKINYSNKDLLDELANEVELSFDDYLRKKKPYLSLDDLKELQKKVLRSEHMCKSC